MTRITLIFLTALLCLHTFNAAAQDDKDKKPKKPKKDKGSKSDDKMGMAFYTIIPFIAEENDDQTGSLMTPKGWSSNKRFAFMSVTGTPNALYTEKPDAIGRIGVGGGDSRKYVSVVGILNVVDMSELDNYSFDLMASRTIDKNSSISVGGMHLFSDADKVDAGPSYYVAYTRSTKNNKLNYTIGAGSGRFIEMSVADKTLRGKGDYGTGIFGNISYKIKKNININAEWTGVNLGLSAQTQIKEKWPVFSLGLTDITRYSGDKPTILLSVAHPFLLKKKNK